MNHDEAVALAQRAAHMFGNSHSYVTSEFMPHEWVIRAIFAAYANGHRDGSSTNAD